MILFTALDRNYANWTWTDEHNGAVSECDCDPVARRMITGDVYYPSTDQVAHKSAFWKEMVIPGVLVCGTGSKTYGRFGKRLLHKCIPNDRSLPAVLVPYECKTVGFSKVLPNKFVGFRLQGPEVTSGKHLIGSLTHTIGDVDDFIAYCDYEMLAKGVSQSIQKFTKSVFLSLKTGLDRTALEERYSISDLSDRRVISVDPEGCRDFDDAFSIQQADGMTTFSVYIANVAVWMDALKLWDRFPGRVSSIYLPDRVVPMLPTSLSEALCSLRSGEHKYVCTMDIAFNDELEVVDVKFYAGKVKVMRNYVYEESDLFVDEEYQAIHSFVRKLCKSRPYVEDIRDSHDVVAFSMLMMNHLAAQRLGTERSGLFRCVQVKDRDVSFLPQEVRCIARAWGSEGGKYTLFQDAKRHDLMPGHVDLYCHLTSPIRRLADLLNQCILLSASGMTVSTEGLEFCQAWVDKCPLINERMKGVRRVQTSAALLHSATVGKDVYGVMDGYVLESGAVEGGLIQHTIYVPCLKAVGQASSMEELDLYNKVSVSLHLFVDEHSLKRKVRFNLL